MMNVYASILCGLLAWAAPVYALMSHRSRPRAAAASAALCAFAIFLQIREYEYRIYLHDWSALEDMCHAETLAAGLLLSVALLLNLLAAFLPRDGKKRP